MERTRQEQLSREGDSAALESALRTVVDILSREFKRRSQCEHGPSSAQPAVAEPKNRLVDAVGLSKYLCLPKPTIYTWVCQKRFPEKSVVRLGRALRFDLREIDAWIQSRDRSN